jgi:hypothetical protein
MLEPHFVSVMQDIEELRDGHHALHAPAVFSVIQLALPAVQAVCKFIYVLYLTGKLKNEKR